MCYKKMRKSVVAISIAVVLLSLLLMAIALLINAPSNKLKLDFDGAAGLAAVIPSFAGILIAAIALYSYTKSEDPTYNAAVLWRHNYDDVLVGIQTLFYSWVEMSNQAVSGGPLKYEEMIKSFAPEIEKRSASLESRLADINKVVLYCLFDDPELLKKWVASQLNLGVSLDRFRIMLEPKRTVGEADMSKSTEALGEADMSKSTEAFIHVLFNLETIQDILINHVRKKTESNDDVYEILAEARTKNIEILHDMSDRLKRLKDAYSKH